MQEFVTEYPVDLRSFLAAQDTNSDFEFVLSHIRFSAANKLMEILGESPKTITFRIETVEDHMNMKMVFRGIIEVEDAPIRTHRLAPTYVGADLANDRMDAMDYAAATAATQRQFESRLWTPGEPPGEAAPQPEVLKPQRRKIDLEWKQTK